MKIHKTQLIALALTLLIFSEPTLWADKKLSIDNRPRQKTTAVDRLVNQIQKSLPGSGSSPEISHSYAGSFFNTLKKIASYLLAKTNVDLADLKKEIVTIIQDLRGLNNRVRVDVKVDKKNRTASASYKMKVQQDVAEELGISENYELYELQVSQKDIKRRMRKK